MSKTWAGPFEESRFSPSCPRDRAARDGARAARAANRRRLGRRRAFALVGTAFVVIVVLVVIMLAGSSLASDDDAFIGVWWEPESGRRVEIAREGDAFTLLYGALRRPFAAERRRDELVIAAPLGGDIVVRAVGDDRLELVDGGRTTVLRPAPDGS